MVGHKTPKQAGRNRGVWTPPKNGVIALWVITRVVKCKYCVSQKRRSELEGIGEFGLLQGTFCLGALDGGVAVTPVVLRGSAPRALAPQEALRKERSWRICPDVDRCRHVFVCSVLRCRHVFVCSVLQLQCVYRVLQCVAVCCNVLQCAAAVYCSLLQCLAVCCSVLQCAAVCCNVLQCVCPDGRTLKTYVCVSAHDRVAKTYRMAFLSFSF